MIKTQKLQEVVNQLYTVVPRRSTMPILQTIRFKTNSHRIKVSATDLDKSMTLYLNSDIEIDVCIPAKQLHETVNFLTSDEVDFTVKDNKVIINKNPGRATIRSGYHAEEFPIVDIPDNDAETFIIDAGILSNALSKAGSTTSKDGSHHVLTGVLLRSEGNVLNVVSADGFRLTVVKILLGLPDFEVIIPGTSIDPLTKILDKQSKVNMSTSESKVVFWNDNFLFTSQIVAGNFPDFKRIIPDEFKTKIRVDKSKLSNAIQQALVYAIDVNNMIKVHLNANEILIIGESSEYGKDHTPISDFEFLGGDEIEIAMNGVYLRDALKLCKNTAELRFNSPTQPIGVYDPENELLIHTLMPMHLGRQ